MMFISYGSTSVLESCLKYNSNIYTCVRLCQKPFLDQTVEDVLHNIAFMFEISKVTFYNSKFTHFQDRWCLELWVHVDPSRRMVRYAGQRGQRGHSAISKVVLQSFEFLRTINQIKPRFI